MSKMKKKYYLILTDYVDRQVLRPANVLRYIQTVDSTGVLMKYFIQPVHHGFFTYLHNSRDH